MIQLWVNLPSKFKMTKPRYQSFDEGDFPIIDQGNHEISIKVIAGTFGIASSKVKTFSAINIYELNGPPNSKLKIPLPVGSNTLVFQLSGMSSIEDQQIKKGNLGLLSKSGETFEMKFLEKSKVMILNGEPLGEPVAAYGPFVMNTRLELMEAFRDFQAGKMGQLVN